MIEALVALVLWCMSTFMNATHPSDVALGPATTVTRTEVVEVVEPDPEVCWLPAVELTAKGGHPNPMLTDDFAGKWAQVQPVRNELPILIGIDPFKPSPDLSPYFCDY